ncbi:MAG: MFS transporter [Mycobacterium leprae]
MAATIAPNTPQPSSTSLRQNTALKTGLFAVAHTINDTYPNLYPILLPELMAQMHFGTAAAGFISTAAALTTQLLQPVMGYEADRLGGRLFVVGGLVVGSLLTGAALGLAPSYWLLVAVLLLAGLGNAAFHPHASAIVGEMAGKRKGFGMSLFMIGGNFGRALAPIVAAGAFMVGGRLGLLTVAIPGLIMALVMAWVMVPAPVPKPRKGPLLTPEFLRGLREAGSLLLVVGLRNMAALTVLTLVPIWYKATGRPLTEAAAMLSLLFLAGSVGNMAGGAASDRFGAKPVMIGSALLSSLLLAAFLSVKSGFLSLVLVALLGAALYSTGSVVMVFGQALFPENRSMASGLTLGIGNTIGSFGVAAMGLIAQYYSPVVGLWVTAGALLLSIPFVLRLKEATR